MDTLLFYAALIAVLWLFGVGLKAIVLTCLAVYGTGWIAFVILIALEAVKHQPKASYFR